MHGEGLGGAQQQIGGIGLVGEDQIGCLEQIGQAYQLPLGHNRGLAIGFGDDIHHLASGVQHHGDDLGGIT